MLERPGSGRAHDHPGPGEQVGQLGPAGLGGEVEVALLLVGVQRPPERGRTGPGPVGAGDVLDLHHAGVEHGTEQPGAQRSRPQSGEVDDERPRIRTRPPGFGVAVDHHGRADELVGRDRHRRRDPEELRAVDRVGDGHRFRRIHHAVPRGTVPRAAHPGCDGRAVVLAGEVHREPPVGRARTRRHDPPADTVPAGAMPRRSRRSRSSAGPSTPSSSPSRAAATSSCASTASTPSIGPAAPDSPSADSSSPGPSGRSVSLSGRPRPRSRRSPRR